MSATLVNPLAPWVATVPKHWQVRRLGSIADVMFSNVDKHTIEGELPIGLCNYTDVYKNDRVTSRIEFMQASGLQREIEKFQVRKGDVLATKDSEDPNDIAVSALIAEELPNVLCGYHLALIRPQPKHLAGEYLAWVQSSKGILAQYEAQAVGVTRFALSQAAFKEAVLPVPPPAEQRRIAGYLDEATGKVDRLVALRRRQMELLREQRAALIQQAVTRGLNPNATFKDSCLLWLGQIPKHWEVKRLGSIATVKARLGWKGLKAEEYVAEGYIFLATPNIKGDEIDFENVNYITKERYQESPEIMLREGDILVAKDGATLGITALVNQLPAPATVNGSIAVIRPYRECSGGFLAAWFRSHSIQRLIDMMKGGMGVPHLFQSDLRRFPIIIPPEKEQLQIIAFIEKETAKLGGLLSAYTRQLELLTEYRAALIHECVTGQRAVPESFTIINPRN